jgi:hypothetical protein
MTAPEVASQGIGFRRAWDSREARCTGADGLAAESSGPLDSCASLGRQRWVGRLALDERLRDCAPQYDREVRVEERPFVGRQRDSLSDVCDRAGEGADADG